MTAANDPAMVIANATPDKIDAVDALQLLPVSVWSLLLAAHRFLPIASVHPLQNREIVRPFRAQPSFELRLCDTPLSIKSFTVASVIARLLTISSSSVSFFGSVLSAIPFSNPPC
jgi:hypothetical protein